ncbi:hypothetical protein LTR36_006850 [Oleoguttula mirabilis]|uniref:Uncharacterized protein n=1 Tax=Oleoguttula mirabilis TaxID=1507867 RepID=A0AAV9JBS8_9PEZI|nr:hypothetical protein LTR36_006850 [Oleoguttula mirabilis]
MSLKEAYHLAHSAQCRLNLEASRPDRNLRFVVGHLMHYESVRLRIVEIEHDIRRSERASAVGFRGTGHHNDRLLHKPSTGDLRRRSPPPPVAADDGDGSSSEDLDDEVDGVEELILTRFASGSARAPQPPPDLEPDDEDYDDYDDDEPQSPEEPDAATLERVMKGDGNELLATIYEGVRKCSCHQKTDAPRIERMWELPAGEGGGKEGVTRAIAQIAVGG